MTTPAKSAAERATAWAEGDERVSGAIVYGSVAHGTDHAFSDVDFVIVAARGQRDALWAEREHIAAVMLDGPVASSQEPTWQRPFRYQAFGTEMDVMADLTFDEGDAWAWAGLADGYDVVVDRDGVAERLAAAMAALAPVEVDAIALDQSTWPWFLHMDSHLRRHHHWAVRAGLYDTLGNRVVAMLGARFNTAESMLSPEHYAALTDAAPRSSDGPELRRALRATVALYDIALDVWAARTGRERPHHPLAPAVRQRIHS